MDFESLPYNIQLLSYKNDAKHHYQKLYKKGIRKGMKKQFAIQRSASWINKQFGRTIDWSTMNGLNIEDCKRIIELIKPYIKAYK